MLSTSHRFMKRVGIDRAMKTLELRTYQQTLLREYVRRKYKLSDIPLMGWIFPL